MPKRSAARNLVVGLVFVGSLVILGMATLAISAVPIFSKVKDLEVRFPTVDNLQVGDSVAIHGYRVGEVKEIKYDPEKYPQAPIVVRCSVPQKVFEQVNEKTQFSIQSEGPLGGRHLEIKPPAPPVPPEAPSPSHMGAAPGDLFQQLASFVEKNEKNLTETINDVRETFRAINAGEGTVGALIKDQEMRAKFTRAMSDLSDQIASLKEEKGSIGFLLNNEKAKEDLKAAISDLREIVQKIREGDGVFSRLVNDSRLGSRLEETLEDVHEVVHKVNTGQGTLGQVINNPKAWDEIVKILVLARETIEDIREQAPISTFVNAIFAAF